MSDNNNGENNQQAAQRAAQQAAQRAMQQAQQAQQPRTSQQGAADQARALQQVVQPVVTTEDKVDYKVMTLGENNYAGWKFQIQHLLESRKLWVYTQDPSRKNEDRAKQATNLILASINYDNILKIINCNTAYDMWQALGCIYENRATGEKQTLLAKFHAFKIHAIKDLSKNLGEIQSMAARLKALGVSIDDDTVMSIILNALPPSFNTFKTSWNLFNIDQRNLNKLISCVLVEAQNMRRPEERAMAAQKSSPPRWAKGRQSPRQNGPNQKPSYVSQSTSSQQRQQNPRRSYKPRDKKNDTCNYCKKKGHWAIECTQKAIDNKKNSSKPKLSMMAVKGSTKLGHTSWIADSGSSSHVTPHLDWLQNLHILDQPIDIRLGNDKLIHALAIGQVSTTIGTINSVYYVPEAAENLFSLSSAAEHGISIYIDQDEMVFSKDGLEVATAPKQDGVYVIDFESQPRGSECTMMARTVNSWHNKFGHPSMNTLIRMIRNNSVDGLQVTKHQDRNEKCIHCARNKCTQTEHRVRTTQRAYKPGLSLHFDTAGPMPIESLGGARYFLLAKDEYSTYRMVKPVSTKQEIKEEVMQMISKAELETGNKVLKIMSDNGSELTNKTLESFLMEKGIVHKLSEPYTPQQNGFIEREVRTVKETFHTLLDKAKLKQELWAEAVCTAVYLLNRTINFRTGVKTPYELWHGRRPNVRNLHTVGESAVILIPKVKRDPECSKGRNVVFIGYTDTFNTFRFYDPLTDEVVVSCDATFLESPYRTSKPDSQPQKESEAETTRNITRRTRVIYPQDNCDTDSDAESLHEETAKPSEETEDSITDQVRHSSNESTRVLWSSALEDTDSTSSDDTITETEQASPQRASTPHRSLGINPEDIPKRLYIRNKPPPVVESRMRTRNNERANLATTVDLEDPRSYSEAMSRPDKKKWLQAMQEEMDSLKKNQVWELVDRPKDNIVTNRWVLKIKRKPDGSVERYRARLVARGFSQRYGEDYWETYAPVANMTSIRMMFAYAAIKGMHIRQFDVKTAFLYGELDATVHMEQPEGFASDSSKVCLLKRSLYGLKQSPRQWNHKFTDFLVQIGLKVSEEDNCIFYQKDPMIFMAIYVDDGIIFSENKREMDRIIDQLSKRFEIHTVESNTFLGFQYYRGTKNEVTIHQESYIKNILKRFNLHESKTVGAPTTLTKEAEDPKPLDKHFPFREAIGSLMYAAVTTRVDIAHAVNKVSRKLTNPDTNDWQAVKRIFRYLRDKEGYGITYSKDGDRGLLAYCDADFAGDPETSRSTTGYVLLFGGAAVHWKSQRQSLVTLSSTEAEFISMCSTIKDLIWLRNLSLELGVIKPAPTKVYCDNQSALRIANNDKVTHRTRHIGAQARYPSEQIKEGHIEVEHIQTSDQLADTLTKPLTVSKFEECNSKLMNLKKQKLMLHWMKKDSNTRNFFATTFMAMITLLTIITMSCAFILQPVDPAIWMQMENLVDDGMTTHVYHFKWVDPCSNIEPMMSRLDPEYSIVPAHDDNKTRYVESRDRKYHMENLYRQCATIFQEKWLWKVNELTDMKPPKRFSGRTITKRAIPLIPLMVGGISVSNFLYSLFSGVKQDRKTASIESKLKESSFRLNMAEKNAELQIMSLEKALEDVKHLKRYLDDTNRRVDQLSNLLGGVSWFTGVFFDHISEKNRLIEEIIEEYSQGRIATRELGHLLNTTLLRGIESQDTVIDSISNKGNILTFEFIVRDRSPDTKVYQVMPIKHWANLTGSPYLLEYIGEEFLIYNETSNCAKSIREPRTRFVQEECNEKDWFDPKLNQWRRNYDANHQMDEYDAPALVRTTDFNYIYCFSQLTNRTIKIQGKDYPCPTFPFRMPTQYDIETGHLKYHSKQYQHLVKETFKMIDNLPFRVHPTTRDTEELNMIARLSDSQRQLQEARKLISIAPIEADLIWTRLGWITLGAIVINTLIFVCMFMRTKTLPSPHIPMAPPMVEPRTNFTRINQNMANNTRHVNMVGNPDIVYSNIRHADVHQMDNIPNFETQNQQHRVPQNDYPNLD